MKETEKGTMTGIGEVSGFRGANYWARHIGREELPVLRRTVFAIARMFSQAGVSSSAVAETVAKDPFMSARLIRMANSAYYNPGVKKVTTVPRAVVVVGFDALRHLCASTRFLEETYSGDRLQEILRCMVLSYKQALLAQWIGETLREGAPEELYAAGLLLDIGLLSLLCVIPHGMVGAFRDRAAGSGLPEKAAEREIFGFETRRLSVRLAEEWSLGDLVKRAAHEREDLDPRVQCVRMGARLAVAHEKGPESEAFAAALGAAVDRLKIPEPSLLRMVTAAEKRAQEYRQDLPAELVGPVPPVKEHVRAAEPLKTQEEPAVGHEDHFLVSLEEVLFEPADAERQLELLDDVVMYLIDKEHASPQGVLDRAVRGILEGAALDRVAYLRMTPEGKFLEVKNLYGEFDPRFLGLLVPTSPYPNVFSHVLWGPPWLWVHENSPPAVKALVTPEVLQFFPSREIFVGRVGRPSSPLGVIAGDRRSGHRALDEKAFIAFRRFCDLVSLGMMALRREG